MSWSGTYAARVASATNAGERRRAEMEGRYRGLLDQAPDPLVTINASGEIVLANAQARKCFGYQAAELVGEKVDKIIPDGFAALFVAGVDSPEDGPKPGGGELIELTARRKDGSAFPIEVAVTRSVDNNGMLITSSLRDISARKTAQTVLQQQLDELNRSNEALVQFAYVASHDLQEPLRAVAISVGRIAEKYAGALDAEAGKCIALAVGGTDRMRHLIDDLLSYSRISTRRNEPTNASSEAALAEALLNLRGAIDEAHAEVTHDTLPVVSADPRQLAQLFQNLIGNAIKFQGTGVPKIHIAAVRDGEAKWAFTVSDTGIGIDAKNFERIFGMFQRLHRRSDYGGTGIGLAICRKIVEQHGGTISVESRPGLGSTFRFTLARPSGTPATAASGSRG